MRVPHHYKGPLTEGYVRLLLKDNPYEVSRIEVNEEAVAQLLGDAEAGKRDLVYTVGARIRNEDGEAVPVIPNPRVPTGQVWLEVR